MAQHTMLERAPAHPPSMTYEEWRAWAPESRLTEWVDGEVILFMPPRIVHQLVTFLLARLVGWFVDRHDLGVVMMAPFEMRLPRSAREPDILFVATEHLGRLGELKLEGPADLAVEIISDDSTTRDKVDKRAEYAAAGVRE